MNIAKIEAAECINGSGWGVSLWISGCSHKCKGCHNPQLWDKNNGKPFNSSDQQLIIDFMEKEYISRLSLTGGDPLENDNLSSLIGLLSKVKETYPNKTVWLWTGYDFDPILSRIMSGKDPNMKALLECVDVLVDGQFVNELKDPSLAFRGSSNQRIIDVRQSLKDGSVIEHKID